MWSSSLLVPETDGGGEAGVRWEGREGEEERGAGVDWCLGFLTSSLIVDGF